MAYTAPSSTAVDFRGRGTYTAPLWDAVNFSFVQTVDAFAIGTLSFDVAAYTGHGAAGDASNLLSFTVAVEAVANFYTCVGAELGLQVAAEGDVPAAAAVVANLQLPAVVRSAIPVQAITAIPVTFAATAAGSGTVYAVVEGALEFYPEVTAGVASIGWAISNLNYTPLVKGAVLKNVVSAVGKTLTVSAQVTGRVEAVATCNWRLPFGVAVPSGHGIGGFASTAFRVTGNSSGTRGVSSAINAAAPFSAAAQVTHNPCTTGAVSFYIPFPTQIYTEHFRTTGRSPDCACFVSEALTTEAWVFTDV